MNEPVVVGGRKTFRRSGLTGGPPKTKRRRHFSFQKWKEAKESAKEHLTTKVFQPFQEKMKALISELPNSTPEDSLKIQHINNLWTEWEKKVHFKWIQSALEVANKYDTTLFHQFDCSGTDNDLKKMITDIRQLMIRMSPKMKGDNRKEVNLLDQMLVSVIS